MKRVKVRHRRNGREKEVRERDARILVQIGRWEYVEAEKPTVKAGPAPKPAPTGDGLDELDYNDLRALAAERDVTPEGRKKDDYIRALRYGTRAMVADEE